MAAVRLILLCLWLGAVVALLGGFAGALHPAGDSLAVFRIQLGIATGILSIGLLAAGPRRVGIAGVAATALAAATLVPETPADAAGPNTLTVYQKNLHWILPDHAPIVGDIRDTGADVAFLQEVHARNIPVLDRLADTHPYSHFCQFRAVGGVALVSRFPIVEGTRRCLEGHGFAAMQVEGPAGPLWLVSLHLYWPWPHSQPADLAALRPVLENLEGPIIAGGDFNMVPWSHTLGELGRASRTRHAGTVGPTFNLITPLLGLPIDHVLIPAEATLLSVERRPLLGSDHRGVLATIALP